MTSRTSSLVLLLVLSLALACSDDDGGSPVEPPDDTPDAVGTIRTWAGTGEAAFDGGGNPLKQSQFYWPIDIEFTENIGTYIVDWNNHLIRRVTSDGRLQTVAGSTLGDGANDLSDLTFPGAPGTACNLNHPTDVFERSNGNLAVVSWHNHKIREWNPSTGNIYVAIGREASCTGDGGAALDAKLNQPVKGVETADGSVYVVDQRNQVVRKIDAAGTITTPIGALACAPGLPAGGFAGDGADPTTAKFNQPTGPNPPPGGGITVDAQGRLYIADMNNHRIRRVDFTVPIIETVVGNGTPAYAGDGGNPTLASINLPADLEFGPDGRLYIADAGNHVIRAVDFTANAIVTVAGTGEAGFSGNGGPATDAKLNNPLGIDFDADGHLYIADSFNHRIRRVKMHE